MSTDYSKISDFEINKRVFILVMNGRDWNRQGSGVFDFCNNPADAWPIIVANNIDIIQDNGQGCALATNSAIQMFQGDDVHISQDENPLRAAMIVFLMMQEDK